MYRTAGIIRGAKYLWRSSPLYYSISSQIKFSHNNRLLAFLVVRIAAGGTTAERGSLGSAAVLLELVWSSGAMPCEMQMRICILHDSINTWNIVPRLKSMNTGIRPKIICRYNFRKCWSVANTAKISPPWKIPATRYLRVHMPKFALSAHQCWLLSFNICLLGLLYVL